MWIALTDATPETSCLYFLPACHDPGYHQTGDAITNIFSDPNSWQSITAQPMSAGGILCFSHRILHWGSRAVKNYPPRIAISLAFSDSTFETPYFNQKFLPFPPIALRAALQAGQAISYCQNVPLTKGMLGLYFRVFKRYEDFFCIAYREKVDGANQWIRYTNAFKR